MTWRGLMIASALILLSFSAGIAHASDKPFGAWVAEFKEKAVAAGVPTLVVESAFANVTPDDYVIELDRKQPEGTVTFTKYISNTVTKRRINEGRMLLEDNRALLTKIAKTYQVEPRFIVALWGIETDYGVNQGNFSVINSLATLAYEGRRAELFERELLAALQILAQGHINQFDLLGSWAGAMGNCQFMPSSYLKFAVDWDQDGVADIWHNKADTFASIANYLHQSGWVEGAGWGKAGGEMYPGTPEEGGFTTTSNYDVILKWNRSRYFATAVGLLSDALGI